MIWAGLLLPIVLAGVVNLVVAQSGGLQGYWQFDDGTGTTALDSSGNNNTGTLVNGPTWTAGKIGGGLSFDGVDDFVDVGNSPSLNPVTTITLAAWVNTSTASKTKMVISKYDSGNFQYFLRLQGAKVRFAVNTGSSVNGPPDSTTVLAANTWYHIAGTYDGSEARLYINGALETSAGKTGNIISVPVNVNIGRRLTGMYFNGVMDDVRIYNRALSASEVAALFAAGSSPLPDATPPSVSITSPASGTTVAATVNVTADASDNVGVAGVQFKVDGTNVGGEDTSSPYSISWDTPSVADGSHTLTAMARDTSNNTTTSAPVNVTVDNTPPSVPTNLTATAVSSTQINLSWSASGDNLSGVAGYRIFRGGSQIATSVSTSYQDTNLSPATTYTYAVAAFDVAGNVSVQSAPASATTQGGGDTTPPTVSITSPTSGSMLLGPVNVTADAADNVGVTGVQFKVNGTNLGGEDTTAPYSVSWDTSSVSDGAYALTAVARDAANNSTTSAAVDVTVDNTPPSVPTNLTATAVSSTQINLSWSASGDNLSGVAGYRIFRGGSQIATSVSTSYQDTNLSPATTYTYTVAAFDAAGNVSSQGLPVSATTPPATSNPGLAGYWKLDDGAGMTALDSSGNNNTGTLFNGPVWTTGKTGGALSFDGLDDYIDVGNGASLNPTNAITLAAWVNASNVSTTKMVVSKYDATSFQYFLRLQGNRVRFAVSTGSAVTGPPDSITVLAANTWYHVVGTYDGAEARLYVNGVLETSVPKTGNIVDVPVNVNIGRRLTGMYFAGLLDDVRIYNRALSAQEVTDLCQCSPSQVGQWSAPTSWPLSAIHGVMLHTGEVLVWDGHDVHGGSTARIWNPTTNGFTSVPVSSNIYCGGHTSLADGRILVAGGHVAADVGIPNLNIFDPVTKVWTSATPMGFARWYPTTTTLPDGRVLITSGSVDCPSCNASIPEIYDPQTNVVTQLTNANLVLPYYPFNFVLPDGRVLSAGAGGLAGDPATGSSSTQVLNVQTQTWTMVDPTLLTASSGVMYLPGKAMKAGANTYVLDMNQPSPAWVQTASLKAPRVADMYLTLLADGAVLATGGANGTTPVFEVEMWSPATNTWAAMAPMNVPREYHSTALLLPDARLLIAGGGHFPGAVAQQNAQIYSPPYLFKGPRPVVTSAPATIQYGSTLSVVTPDAAKIARVTLIRPGAATHGFNQDQRFLTLAFQQASGALNVEAPANANLAPPGYYMLFILDTDGVPSIASFVRLQ